MLLSAVMIAPSLGLTGCQRTPAGMVWIPGGPFVMGTNDVDAQGLAQLYGLTKPWFEDEHPAHTVDLPGYYLDRNEVTNADFAAYVTATNSRVPGTWHAATYPGGAADLPVVSVNWYQARDYCAWAHKRLPTEAEWEKAARGTDGRLYPWGNDFGLDKANLMSNQVQPVGLFPQGRSPYGVNDLIGNVWEWTADWYEPYPGSTTVSKDFGQKFKVVRGKSWTMGFGHQEQAEVKQIIAHEARGSFRLYFDPVFGFNDLGFRCAASP
ncbi:MAG TPA: SUMF1/EgtB/PvdO family nonheme iron enzyme [Nitrospiria bacterium]|nr:SUMF1/EgtB/PvdO family nonheme iron enzyme [Nitrospiria bacterium]